MTLHVLVLACLLPVAGAFVVSAGLFTIDEFIYVLSVEAMASRGALTIENGYGMLPFEDLRLWFLVDGPNGLVPQYPPGVAILGAPFYALFGVRGLLLLNALAAAGVAVLTYRIARRLYPDPAVAVVAVAMLVFGTFHLDYAWSVWPHMTSAFFVVAAFHLALKALDVDRGAAVFGLAAVSGLAVGAGVLMRTDAVLVLPIIGAAVVLYARRPVLTILGGAVGLAPCLAALAAMNHLKFGTFNILTYGRTGAGGGDDMTSHIGAAVVMAAAFAFILVARRLTWSPRFAVPAAVGLAGGVVLLMAIPETAGLLRRLGTGYLALFVDARTIVDPREGVGFTADGSLLFWGVAKKALFQSLPWLGVLAALVLGRWAREDRRGHVLLLIFVLVWSLPFATIAWHGGFSSSMRYFLPMLPALTILGAALVVRLASEVTRPVALVTGGAVLGLCLSLAAFVSGEVSAGESQQALNLAIFVVIAGAVAAAAVSARGAVGRALRIAAVTGVGFGIGAAVFGGLVVDLSFSQMVRERSAAISAAAETVEGPALFYGLPEHFAFAADRPEVHVGIFDRLTREADPALFEAALGAGYRVFAAIGTATELAGRTGLGHVGTPMFPDGSIVEITSRPAESGAQTASLRQ